MSEHPWLGMSFLKCPRHGDSGVLGTIGVLGPGWLPGGDLFYSTRCVVSWNFRSVMTASCQGPVNRFTGSNDWEQRSPGLEHRGRLLLPSPWSLVTELQNY